MDLIFNYDYHKNCRMSALGALHALAEAGTEAIVCRIRQSADNVLFIHSETTMTRLCSCDEYVSDLRFCEIDAMMRLCGYSTLTLKELLEGYEGNTRLILHFRCFRPNADVISRIVRDSRFSFATDSIEQLSVIAEGFPAHQTVGFACHLPAAEAMAQRGASAVCMYGREVQGFGRMDFSHVTEKCPVWYEFTRKPEEGLDYAMKEAQRLNFQKAVLPIDFLQ